MKWEEEALKKDFFVKLYNSIILFLPDNSIISFGVQFNTNNNVTTPKSISKYSLKGNATSAKSSTKTSFYHYKSNLNNSVLVIILVLIGFLCLILASTLIYLLTRGKKQQFEEKHLNLFDEASSAYLSNTDDSIERNTLSNTYEEEEEGASSFISRYEYYNEVSNDCFFPCDYSCNNDCKNNGTLSPSNYEHGTEIIWTDRGGDSSTAPSTDKTSDIHIGSYCESSNLELEQVNSADLPSFSNRCTNNFTNNTYKMNDQKREPNLSSWMNKKKKEHVKTNTDLKSVISDITNPSLFSNTFDKTLVFLEEEEATTTTFRDLVEEKNKPDVDASSLVEIVTLNNSSPSLTMEVSSDDKQDVPFDEYP